MSAQTTSYHLMQSPTTHINKLNLYSDYVISWFYNSVIANLQLETKLLQNNLKRNNLAKQNGSENPCYLVQSLFCRGGAAAVVLRSHLCLLRFLQEILSRSRLPGVPSWPGPLQNPIELLGQSYVELRLCGQRLGVQAQVSAGGLTLSAEPCVRDDILEDLGLGLRKGIRKSTGSRKQRGVIKL